MASASIVRHVRPERGRLVLRCLACGHTADPAAFKYGRGRPFHPDHRYCPGCGQSIDYRGYGLVDEGKATS